MMTDTSATAWTWRVKPVMLACCLLFFWGCVSGQQQENTTGKLTGTAVKRTLVSMAYMPDQPGVRLVGSEKLVYTAIRQEVPRGVVLYLPATGIDGAVTDMVSQSGAITFVSARPVKQNSTTVKVEILVERQFQYQVVEAEKEIQILFSLESREQPEVSSDTAPAAVAGEDQGFVMGKDPQGNTVLFTQEELPLDLSGVTTVADNQVNHENTRKTIPPDSTSSSGGGTALTDIRFTSTETGTSTLTLETGMPIPYDVERTRENQLKLFLFNTKIPVNHQRPLITTYFNSAVERVLPVQARDDETNSYILIQLRYKTPYRVSRDANRLILVFDPAPVTVPEFNQARVVLNANDVTLNGGEALSEDTDRRNQAGNPGENGREDSAVQAPSFPMSFSESAEAGKSSESAPAMDDTAPKYTGEKISLDFYETDIKNVFRILRTISGENFAIDKDVTGNVTLAFDQPVPWDQVLDLVLKMNNLGKVREGNIIRIATQAALKREFEGEQKALAAKQQAEEQKKKLEPLVTEYVPINYASAETDIKPHLEKFLTSERGQLSVDERTNTIIITDVQQKVDQAKDLILRLDKVTPQIMIEARVVEVSKDFSREIGIEWGVSSEDVYRSDLGGTYGFDVAMNYPAASDSSISYTFSRVAGTPFALNAKLTAAEAKGNGKIISSPRILTLDNKKATITQGLEYPYQVVEDDEVSTEFIDIDLTLEVTPHVTQDKRVNMEFMIKKSDITGYADTGEPVVSKSEATTELLVDDGSTIVIGGIVTQTTTDDTKGFPFLSNIPILGHLFRSDSKADSKNELLIFLTPTIVQLEQKKQ